VGLATAQRSKAVVTLAGGYDQAAAAQLAGAATAYRATGGGSPNPVVFSVDPATTNSACSLGTDGFTASFNHAGSCVIDANQAGDTNYAAATQAQQPVTVGKATPVITWANPADITWGTPLSATQLDATASVRVTAGVSACSSRRPITQREQMHRVAEFPSGPALQRKRRQRLWWARNLFWRAGSFLPGSDPRSLGAQPTWQAAPSRSQGGSSGSTARRASPPKWPAGRGCRV